MEDMISDVPIGEQWFTWSCCRPRQRDSLSRLPHSHHPFSNLHLYGLAPIRILDRAAEGQWSPHQLHLGLSCSPGTCRPLLLYNTLLPAQTGYWKQRSCLIGTVHKLMSAIHFQGRLWCFSINPTRWLSKYVRNSSYLPSNNVISLPLSKVCRVVECVCVCVCKMWLDSTKSLLVIGSGCHD